MGLASLPLIYNLTQKTRRWGCLFLYHPPKKTPLCIKTYRERNIVGYGWMGWLPLGATTRDHGDV